MEHEVLTTLTPGMAIPWGGTNIAIVSDELADAFRPGDALIVLQTTGELIHVPGDVRTVASEAVSAAVAAFEAMGGVSDDEITDFFHRFADALDDDDVYGAIAQANAADVERARGAGRSVTRLVLDEPMRRGMIDGLRSWAEAPSRRGEVIDVVEHEGWKLEQVMDGLGVIGFVFEGRPNVFADATGVLRSGNTVVFRIGSDALGTAEAIVEGALDPALEASGLPAGAASLVASASRESGIAMMADSRLGLAVARGSGPATTRLGAVARQVGNPVSLHGTGGAWIVAGERADEQRFAAAVYHSLDRKVCNTLNTVCIPRKRVEDLMPVFLHALERAGQRLGTNPKLHVLDASVDEVPPDWFKSTVVISRAEGDVDEPKAEPISELELGREWEWEGSPEVTVAVVDDPAQATAWFNEYSPRFVASIVSDDVAEVDDFFAAVDAPFVGNGFTRWVDGQYALNEPELGLSNWEGGRLFGRGGILSGNSAFTVRSRVTQTDFEIGR